MKRHLRVAVLLGLYACGGDGTGTTEPGRVPTHLEVSPPALAVDDGASAQATATLRDQNGAAFTTLPAGVSISWSSSLEEIATVSPQGLVTGQRPGEARIVAEAAGLRGEVPATVRAVARSVEQAGGSGQQGTAGTPLAEAVAVRVVDRHGGGVGGVPVEWVVTGGGGSLAPASATTDTQGYARAAWTLGPVAGANTAEARVPGLSGSPVAFSATGTAGVGAALVYVAGNGQTGLVDRPLPQPLVARVNDANGNPVAGAIVTWRVTGGTGALTPVIGTTNAAGESQSAWTLGPQAGVNTATATAGGGTVAFSATALQAPSAFTGVASGIGSGGATLAGEVNPNGSATTAFFEWGTRSTLAGAVATAAQSVGSGVTAVSLSAPLGGLAPGTVYYFRVAATNSAGRGEGAIRSFTTAAASPASVRIVTFGDSNTDYGYDSSGSTPQVASYLSWRKAVRLSPTAPHSPLQLAGKIEARWRAIRPEVAVRAVNHGIGSTGSGSARSDFSSPSPQTVVNGTTRFDAEVLGRGAPWNGGESVNAYFDGPITRVQAFTPGREDFLYLSIGTNDVSFGISPATSVANLTWMVDRWIGAGLPASHVMITTLAPRNGTEDAGFPQINDGIRALAASRGIHLIDLAAHTSDDNGLNWKSATLHVGDEIHYTDAVREWLAGRIVTYMSARTP